MGKSKHTPGPFSAHKSTANFWNVVQGLGKYSPTVATVHPYAAHGIFAEECEANARLIAAAPDLLEALYSAKAFIEAEYRDPAAEPNGEWLAAEARAPHALICNAIAKAEGGAQ